MIECDMKNELCGGRCTGYDGSDKWDQIHKISDSIECDSCREDGKALMVFSHDFVNARLGKPLFDEKNFKKHVDAIKCLCGKLGVC